jgi:hypothetical protein
LVLRVFVLRTEMQNAVDAAALAAAREFNGEVGAQIRARAAARDLLVHANHFARVKELLGSAGLPDEAFTFYCSIGSKYDVEVECTGASEDGKVLATSDADTHYVKVRLEPREGDGHFVVDLFFLPVLSLISDDVAKTASLNAEAVAGRSFFQCNYPPLMVCDPFEGGAVISGVNDIREAVDQGYLNPGDRVVLKYQSDAWAPGDFAFLLPGSQGDYEHGARELGEYIANPTRQSCEPPEVRTKPGSVQSWPVWAINTYFDLYKSFDANDYPPASDVMEYPAGSVWKSWDTGNRFGTSDWPRDSYWSSYHASQGHTKPAGYDSMTRWQVYNWEISSGNVPCDPGGVDGDISTASDNIACPSTPVHIDPDHLPLSYTDPAPTPDTGTDPENRVLDGYPAPNHVFFDAYPHAKPNSLPTRRRLYVATISCDAQNVHGNTDAVVDAFTEFFVLQRAVQGGGPLERVDIVTEFMGLVGEENQDHHVDVQLYE